MKDSAARLFLLLVTPALGAQTFVVDAANGPGTHFTSITAAVAAVPNGATLEVRAGTYAGFAVVGKGLEILCDPGVSLATTFLPAISVQQLPANESFVLHGATAALGPNAAVFVGCQGMVLLEELSGFAMAATNCAQIMLRSCSLHDVSLTSCITALEACTLIGTNASTISNPPTSARSGLHVFGGQAQLVDCLLYGGGGASALSQANAPAFSMNLAAVRLLGGSRLISGQVTLHVGAPAVAGTGGLRIDPSVALIPTPGQPQVDPGITAQFVVMPHVRSHSAGLGGTLVGEALGPVGSLTVLVVGLPSPPVTLPGIADAFWIEPTAHAFVAIGIPSPGVPLSAVAPVPNAPAFRGLPIAWQSASLVTGSLEASNPSLSLVR